MVESEFGLKKFIDATTNYIPKDNLNSLQLNINIETITAVKNSENILESDYINSLYGVTIGRVDLVSSMGFNREYVNSSEVYDITKSIFSKVKEKGLKACMGGAISVDSYDFIKRLHSDGLLDKFETRYVIFDPSITLKNLSRALMKAQLFEYEWLKTKQDFYSLLTYQDDKRLQMIQERINQSINFK